MKIRSRRSYDSAGELPSPISAPGPSEGTQDFLVVAIGTSAGGLDACRKLISAVPVDNRIAFVLVQHPDPTRESIEADALAGFTTQTVLAAADGMQLKPGHLYVVPPGAYPAIADDALHLTRNGARLPFDFLLHSLAQECGALAVGVILSGTGSDGSVALSAVKSGGGLVIAQDPGEASYDGMPRSAIATGMVDLVLPAAKIPQALIDHCRDLAVGGDLDGASSTTEPDQLAEIVDLLRRANHDFTLYKTGTLRRRIERRMGIAGLGIDQLDRYRDLLRADAGERELLADDLLINVTSFFRDPKVFEVLAEKIVPDLVDNHAFDRPIRIWVAGCSTGEETYSLAMLFFERIAATRPKLKLQVFASDVDPDAIACARDGLYPEAIAAEVSPERLARFFTRDDRGYRASAVLRASVVFTVQNLLADPPFSHLDLISCRNLLIYLRPEAHAKIISLFHFALREGGILLLGSAEAIPYLDSHFEAIARPERIYRHGGGAPSGELRISLGEGSFLSARPKPHPAASYETALAAVCQRLVLETYAPAAVLINRKHECLYSLGTTDRYMRLASGYPTTDFLAMVREELRPRLRAAIQRALQTNARVVVAGVSNGPEEDLVPFSVDIRPVPNHGEDLLLVCFVDRPMQEQGPPASLSPDDLLRVAGLEEELKATQYELEGTIRHLEQSNEEQRTFREEALSIREEYQSTNEELATLNAELKARNAELAMQNLQLQAVLARHEEVATELRNVLHGTDVATLFLDRDLNIRLFTPATKLLFHVIASDIGRPLADLRSTSTDSALLIDASEVLRTLVPIEREIKADHGTWYVRRISPYRAHDDKVNGVIITFVDITKTRQAIDALAASEREAQAATATKSRFLAAASHDLRQPLQTLELLQGMLAKAVAGEKASNLVSRLSEMLGSMSGMLNTLLDLNQIETGAVRTEIGRFSIGGLLDRLRSEFTYLAEARGLTLRVVSCGAMIESDQLLLEQMVRNLLTNALKYTKRGKVLLGCRRRQGKLSIEICDTGIGIAANELGAIFEEYYQVNNAPRERSRGLGLGLSIVQHLAVLLGHQVRVSSYPGRGSVFTVEIALPTDATARPNPRQEGGDDDPVEAAPRTGSILVVEDEPELRDLLRLFLENEGHHTVVAANGTSALELGAPPDLILADFTLPNSISGLDVVTKLRQKAHRAIPAIILTGDTSTGTARAVAQQDCAQLNKPVKLKELSQAIQRLLANAAPPPAQDAAGRSNQPVIFVVDDDPRIREQIRAVLEDDGRIVEDFESCEKFLQAFHWGRQGCLLVDAYLPGMKGLELLRYLGATGRQIPTIMVTGNSDVGMAVKAMKAGALDFIEKPIRGSDLLANVARALEQACQVMTPAAERESGAGHPLARLTPRQRQIMELVLAGHPSKNIAADLGISQRTVENHRASIMKKVGVKSLPALARLVFGMK